MFLLQPYHLFMYYHLPQHQLEYSGLWSPFRPLILFSNKKTLYLYSTATTEHHLQVMVCPEVWKVRLAVHTAQLEGCCTIAQKRLGSQASHRLPILFKHSTSLISNHQYLSINAPLRDFLLRLKTDCIKYFFHAVPLFFKQTSPLISPGSLL